jgi:hypothetical protein
MKSLILLFAITSIFTYTYAEISGNTGEIISEPLDIGDPDAFGYSWIDNDSAGGPTYEWIDITGYGTQVYGLMDDNNVGPFAMGFEFPYYWYTVDHLWIGSNGYISFSSNANFAHPFAGIPFSGLPNDIIAILVGDLDFTQGNGECWIYSNNIDTLIISFLHVREFAAASSSHTFQVILCAGDSTIKFQYGYNLGNFLDSNGEHLCVIGIENCGGTVGLEYMHNLHPAYRLWHDGLAIVFYPEPDPAFSIHDVAIKNALNGTSGGEFIRLNEAYSLKARLENVGNQIEDFSIRCRVRSGFTTLYDETEDLVEVIPGEIIWHEFQQQFIPTQPVTFRVNFDMILIGDMCPYNNGIMVELDSYYLPQEIAYCNDIAETGRMDGGDSAGFAVEFQIPEAIEIVSASFYVSHFYSNSSTTLKILSDDGTGKPDDLNPLAVVPVSVSDDGWIYTDLSSNNLFLSRSRKFYMAVTTQDIEGFLFGMDQSIPYSNRGWIYEDEIVPDMFRFDMDIMFKLFVNPWPEGGCPYVVGDVNNNGAANGLDVIYSVNYFKGGPEPVDVCECLGRYLLETGDVDNSCSFNALDITQMVNYYKGEAYLYPCEDCLPQE